MKLRNIYILVFITFFHCVSIAQEVKRPKMWGIAKMTFLVSDFEVAREYYGRYLGFDEAFSYESELGEVISFKVNDRQFLEFIEDVDAKSKSRLVSYSIETENIEQMRKYLQQNEVKLPKSVKNDAFVESKPSTSTVLFWFMIIPECLSNLYSFQNSQNTKNQKENFFLKTEYQNEFIMLVYILNKWLTKIRFTQEY